MKDKKTRDDIEFLIIQFYDKVDKTGINSEWMQEKLAKMSDAQFWKWLERRYPMTFEYNTWETEPVMKDFKEAAKIIGVNVVEKIALPYLHKNKEGVPINSEPVLPVCIHLKRVQQFNSVKTHISPHTEARDATGRLTYDKGSATSAPEFASMATFGLDSAYDEFSSIKADALNANAEAMNAIIQKGYLTKDDYSVEQDDSVSRNLLAAHFTSCHIVTNLVSDIEDGLVTPYTIRERELSSKRGE